MMMSTARFSNSSRKPHRRKMFSPQQMGVLVEARTSRMASMFSGGTGSSSHISLNGSTSLATRLAVPAS